MKISNQGFSVDHSITLQLATIGHAVYKSGWLTFPMLHVTFSSIPEGLLTLNVQCFKCRYVHKGVGTQGIYIMAESYQLLLTFFMRACIWKNIAYVEDGLETIWEGITVSNEWPAFPGLAFQVGSQYRVFLLRTKTA